MHVYLLFFQWKNKHNGVSLDYFRCMCAHPCVRVSVCFHVKRKRYLQDFPEGITRGLITDQSIFLPFAFCWGWPQEVRVLSPSAESACLTSASYCGLLEVETFCPHQTVVVGEDHFSSAALTARGIIQYKTRELPSREITPGVSVWLVDVLDDSTHNLFPAASKR